MRGMDTRIPFLSPSPPTTSPHYSTHFHFHILSTIAILTKPLPTMPGEVMWPRLVVSKIFRKTLGSNNFVADFPDNADSYLPNMELEPEVSPNKTIVGDHEDINHNYKVFVSTWNVGGKAPTEDLNMDELLDTFNTSCDIYVLGFQEAVPLRASNVLGSEKKKISMKWNSLIRQTLNKKMSEKQVALCSRDKKSLESNIQQDFRCLISKQMVGILISVWVRSDLHSYFRNPSVSCVGCGILGCLGNKGSVSVRFKLHETSFCFICCHLASGGREGDEKTRNSNAAEIMSRTSFPTGPSLDLPRKIIDHDRVVMLGDLNYRISLPELTTRVLVNKRDWNSLRSNDQLRVEFMESQAFEGWQEGTINFAPTYKYKLNSNEYYGGGYGHKGKKNRAPAWCDRIIWFGEGLKQLVYTRSESKLSDHRPVIAIFNAQVRVSRKPKGFRSFFVSERFDGRLKGNFEFPSLEEEEEQFNYGRLSFQSKNEWTT